MAERLFQIKTEFAELEQWLDDIDRRVSKSVAASTITTLARAARTDSIKEGAARIGVRTSDTRKRIRVWRAKPSNLEAGVIANTLDIPESSLGAKQKGHPGRRRRSNTKEAKRARARRRAEGARAARPGGVQSRGRSFPGAWLGTRKSKKGGTQVFRRRSNSGKRGGRLSVEKRDWNPVRDVIRRNQTKQQSRWSSLFAERFMAALRKRGRTRTTAFLEATQ